MQQIILITGTPRSGIEIIAGIFAACAGTVPKRRRYFGMSAFQSQELHRLTVAPMLQGLGADPRGQSPLPDPDQVHRTIRTAGTLRRSVDTFFQQRFPKAETVFFADPCLALLWPVWHEAYPLARWVVARRPIPEIVEACTRTRWMSAYSEPEAWARWARAYEEWFREIPNRRDVWPGRILDGDASEIRSAVEDAGLVWDSGGVEAFLSPVLWRRGTFDGFGGAKDGS